MQVDRFSAQAAWFRGNANADLISQEMEGGPEEKLGCLWTAAVESRTEHAVAHRCCYCSSVAPL